ncbi:hypothetical protein FRC07_006516 [Ceratobasidium sp. 392]|nr:hypothetical protein FRC07_006516 [Ceratobasidium sp. 392]
MVFKECHTVIPTPTYAVLRDPLKAHVDRCVVNVHGTRRLCYIDAWVIEMIRISPLPDVGERDGIGANISGFEVNKPDQDVIQVDVRRRPDVSKQDSDVVDVSGQDVNNLDVSEWDIEELDVSEQDVSRLDVS